ncbi:CheR family methyltransferase [Methylobacterium sp. J-076]|uniref:CheR family methyltransferase n=1 Tax=Methylobacterium sp. J-076 TaxID=2836655 RepID=UPI001FB902F5|nr:protein-glutamate O-methyltransferase CheR [Methylobacterium sp. J-076]MCJ2013284.1 protein-glutamate methyltransferase [Methylobacterium sp. J-076]
MRPPGKPKPDPNADPAYPGLKARIVARTGHAYYADKDDLLVDRLYRRLRETGTPDFAAYLALLSDAAAGEAEWARLEAEITIGETFFFRYSEQFAALRTTILPDLVASRRAERRLRIWSAGCSTGAEPYSLAILVREILGEALPDWRVAILGTDISAEAIATARAAEYGRWALRTMPPEERLRYFTHLPPKPGLRREGGFNLRPEYRGMVRFAQGNLLKVAEPAGPEEGYDLILCRNVLIYFDAATVTRVVHGLGRRLRPEGWLLLGHAEPNPTFSAFLDPVSLPGTVAYRPGGTNPADRAPQPRPPQPPPDPEVPAPGVPCEGGLRDAPRPREPAFAADVAVPQDGEGERTRLPAPPSDAAPAPEDPASLVRTLADAGETGAAWRAVRAALEREPMNPRLRFYEGLVAASLGREVEAERALRATLYLDRGFVMAHYHLGLLLLGQGRRVEAARALDNALALSQALPPDARLPEGDGALAAEVAAGVAAALGRDGGTMGGRA